jgi:FkbM family methyltransferase
LLETEYNWTGILAEPAKIWHDDLYKNRKCSIDTNCVWSTTGEQLQFNETQEPEYSTIEKFSSSDEHLHKRDSNNNKYTVDTISLMDLLEKYHAPQNIDYLSIDTEGSEYDILSNFDFNKYNIKIITCEHNRTRSQQLINDLLVSKGYRRYEDNGCWFDDWFIKND